MKKIVYSAVAGSVILLVISAILATSQFISSKMFPQTQVTMFYHQPHQVNEISTNLSRDGHYVVRGEINQKRVSMFVDTGATDVAIPKSLAKKLGLKLGQGGYASTAGGETRIYATKIKTLKIGKIVLHDVPASVTAAIPPQVILLGMSALKKLELSQNTHGVLTLRQIV